MNCKLGWDKLIRNTCQHLYTSFLSRIKKHNTKSIKKKKKRQSIELNLVTKRIIFPYYNGFWLNNKIYRYFY